MICNTISQQILSFFDNSTRFKNNVCLLINNQAENSVGGMKTKGNVEGSGQETTEPEEKN